MDNYILLADDDDDDINFFKECFVEVCPNKLLLVAKNGREVLDLLATGILPYCIVIDLNMPLMNGQECLVEIRQQPVYDSSKVIILSTSNSDHDRKDCLAKGADEYFVKPGNFADLKSMIQEACNF